MGWWKPPSVENMFSQKEFNLWSYLKTYGISVCGTIKATQRFFIRFSLSPGRIYLNLPNWRFMWKKKKLQQPKGKLFAAAVKIDWMYTEWQCEVAGPNKSMAPISKGRRRWKDSACVCREKRCGLIPAVPMAYGCRFDRRDCWVRVVEWVVDGCWRVD